MLAVGVLLPWWLAQRGVRWSATQAAAADAIAVALAVVALGRYARALGGFVRRRVRVATVTLLALVVACALLVTMRARVDQLRGELRDATMTADAEGRVLRIDGYISDDFVADLEARLARSPGVRRIDITSPGGLADEALRAADIVRSRSLRVRVVDQCASGCVLMWAASTSREMELTALIGVHRARIDPATPEAWVPGVRGKFEERSLSLLRAAGFTEAMLERRADTAADDMAVFDAADLLDHGVAVGVVDDEGVALAPRRVRALLGRAPEGTRSR